MSQICARELLLILPCAWGKRREEKARHCNHQRSLLSHDTALQEPVFRYIFFSLCPAISRSTWLKGFVVVRPSLAVGFCFDRKLPELCAVLLSVFLALSVEIRTQRLFSFVIDHYFSLLKGLCGSSALPKRQGLNRSWKTDCVGSWVAMATVVDRLLTWSICFFLSVSLFLSGPMLLLLIPSPFPNFYLLLSHLSLFQNHHGRRICGGDSVVRPFADSLFFFLFFLFFASSSTSCSDFLFLSLPFSLLRISLFLCFLSFYEINSFNQFAIEATRSYKINRDIINLTLSYPVSTFILFVFKQTPSALTSSARLKTLTISIWRKNGTGSHRS